MGWVRMRKCGWFWEGQMEEVQVRKGRLEKGWIKKVERKKENTRI